LKTSDLFVKALENEGVEYIFGIPGEENLDVLNSLKDSSITLVLTRHEQAAGFMAATYGRLTGKPGVCISTLGPGATNLVTAAAYAQLGAMPLVMITGQKPITKSKQARFQIINIVEMMRPLTKLTKQVVHGHTITATVRESFRLAREERPGAVHIELPEDIAEPIGQRKPGQIANGPKVVRQ
jgi:acetolactate synthase-1/2/3 large subunit